MFTPKNASTAEPRVYVRCPPRSLASELLPRATGWFRAHRVRSQASSYRGQSDDSVPAAFARKRAPTAGNRMVRCPPRSPVGVRLRTNLPQRIQNLHTQNRPHGRTAGLRSVPAAFARKRAPTAGNRMVSCPPRSRASGNAIRITNH